MTADEIKIFNEKCPYGQGIFSEPYGIPTRVKVPVIYSRYETGGMSGGNCWGDEPRYYSEEPPKDRMKVLDLFLEEYFPNITYLQYKKIDALVQDNSGSDNEYYGNSTDWKVEYIILSELEELLAEMKNT
jgi:hypothetical protein